jgi:DNA polymerase sigma
MPPWKNFKGTMSSYTKVWLVLSFIMEVAAARSVKLEILFFFSNTAGDSLNDAKNGSWLLHLRLQCD